MKRLMLWGFVALAACGGGEARRVGYFKDGSENRVLTFEMGSGATAEEIHAHARDLGWTRGQVLAAYYYPSGSVIPADGVTLARSLFAANHVLYDTPGLGKWRFAFMRSIGGAELFVDCVSSPTDGLCRK